MELSKFIEFYECAKKGVVLEYSIGQSKVITSDISFISTNDKNYTLYSFQDRKIYYKHEDFTEEIFDYLINKKNKFLAIILILHGCFIQILSNKQVNIEKFKAFIKDLKIPIAALKQRENISYYIKFICNKYNLKEEALSFMLLNQEWKNAAEYFHKLPVERMIALYPREPVARAEFDSNVCNREDREEVCFFPAWIREREKNEALQALPGGQEYQEALARFTDAQNDLADWRPWANECSLNLILFYIIFDNGRHFPP